MVALELLFSILMDIALIIVVYSMSSSVKKRRSVERDTTILTTPKEIKLIFV